MRSDRLELVAKTLEGVPDEKFVMSTWARKSDCGTCGCAVGHYADKHPEQGLSLEWINHKAGLVFDGEGGWNAVTAHFDIGEDDAYHLFDDEAYEWPVRREKVIARIREFIASGGKVPA